MKTIFKAKDYSHFDNKIEFDLRVENYIKEFKKNSHHSFLPLIYDEISFEKYLSLDTSNDGHYNRINNNGKLSKVPIKLKIRPIMYASHLDNYIYKYYGIELDELYNSYLIQNKFDESSIAYRTNKLGKNNIHFAAEVIDFIHKNPGSYIYVGDFTGFFDNLKHNYLKSMIAILYKTKSIPKHQYTIFKNMTKYSYINKIDIDFYVNNKSGKYQKGYNRIFKNVKDFRSFKKEKSTVKNSSTPVLQINRNDFGIPQGTAISAIYSNIYMLIADKFINDLISKYHGIYRRYSDDYIIVLPKITYETFETIKNTVDTFLKETISLTIHPEKTRSILFSDGKLMNLENSSVCSLDYLGFSYDGKSVKIREKSIYKYYRTAYKLINKGLIISIKKGDIGSKYRLTYKRKLYQNYHRFGELTDKKYSYKKRKYGTFISYAYKSQKIFDQLSPNTINLMKKQIAKHERKITNKINKESKKLRVLNTSRKKLE